MIIKVYYDSSLIKSVIRIPKNSKNIKFNFLENEFNEIDSIFYFKDEIRFVGAMWENI